MGFVELDDGTRVHTSLLPRPEGLMEVHILPESPEETKEHIIEVNCWCNPDVIERGFEDIRVEHVDFFDCEGLPADDPAHEGKWDTKNGSFRNCSWCGVVHPEDD